MQQRCGMAHEQESGMATHQFPIGQQIHEERGSIIKRSCSLSSFGRSARAVSPCEQNTSPECTLLQKTHFDAVLTNRNFHVSEFQSFIQAKEDTLILLHMDNETLQGHSKACDRPVFRDTRAIRATMGFCNRKGYRDIPFHSLHLDPGWSKSLALTM